MSHHFPGEGCKINYNSDLSGDIAIIDRHGTRIEVPGRDILDFVAQFVHGRQIAKLEQMETHEILGLAEHEVPN